MENNNTGEKGIKKIKYPNKHLTNWSTMTPSLQNTCDEFTLLGHGGFCRAEVQSEPYLPHGFVPQKHVKFL